MHKGANVLVQSKILEVKVALGNLWNCNAESIDLLDNGGMLKEVLQAQMYFDEARNICSVLRLAEGLVSVASEFNPSNDHLEDTIKPEDGTSQSNWGPKRTTSSAQG